MHKLSHVVGDGWEPYSHGPVYAVLSRDGSERLLAGVPGGDPSPFLGLVSSLEPPYLLLYVLHTPRGEGDAGRYQSPPVALMELHEFMGKFGRYLSSDARFDFWAHSPAEQATVVWDRHDQLVAYGPLDRFSAVLNALGFTHGDARVPSPHRHHYRREFDADAKALLDHFSWLFTPLLPEDEQRSGR